jgi:hypothetical protein
MHSSEGLEPTAPERRWFLKRGTAGGADIVTDVERRDREGAARIRCPLCDWQPTASSRWSCTRVDVPEGFRQGCGTTWNTFSTRGKCPGCGHQWRWTKCMRCDGWSLHDDWYEEESAG